MLKSLELFGFKSFADRTRFDFHPGITAVVGPNGSGKSNIVDAIKWILGDQSAKGLRGKEMTDVIFNGAPGRNPTNLAEATLTFDNSSGFLPCEMQEVQVGRRIYRSGDAEYLINRTVSRLKDVRDLFMGTGAGSATYVIIEQGRVDQILQANATNRRLVFEEAAGISRYKARKTETMRKLERVEQHLLRLTDIVDEVQAQLNSTRNQASKASRHRDISDELRELRLGLAADDSRHLIAKLQEFERVGADYESQITELNRELETAESRLASIDVEIADLDDRLRIVERRSAANREEIAGHESTLRHQKVRITELDSERMRLRQQRARLAARAREVVGEYEHNKRILGQSEAEFAHRHGDIVTRQQQLADQAARIAEQRQEIEQKKQELFDRTKQISVCENRGAALQSQLQDAEHSEQQAEHRRDELDSQIADCRAECRQQTQTVRQADEQVAVAEKKSQKLHDQRKMLTGKQGQFQQTLAEQREQRSAWQARSNVLEDLEHRQEGMGIGVKEILARASTSHHPPWNKILGSVADLLEVDLEQAALLEVAMGDRAQLIVIEEFDALIDYIHSAACRISGRVGFVVPLREQWKDEGRRMKDEPDSELQPSTFNLQPSSPGRRFDHFQIDAAALPDLSDHVGVVNRCDRLVRSSPKSPDLARHLLADTWIVETLETALDLSAGAGQGCRFVTLQGELLDSDGTVFVGTVRSELALVSRKSELRRLKIDLTRLESRIAEEEKQLANLDQLLANADVDLQAAETELQQTIERKAVRKAELAEQNRRLAQLLSDRESFEAEIDRAAAQQEQSRCHLRDAQMELARAEEDLQALQTEIERAERNLARQVHRQQTFEERRTTGQLDLAKHEERIVALRTACERLEQELVVRNQQRDEADRRCRMNESKTRQVGLFVLNTNALLAELILREEQSAEKTAALMDIQERLRSRRTDHLRQQAEIRKQRRELNEAQHREEIKVRDVRHQIGTLSERIDEEYHLKLSDVVNSGASAIKHYYEQLQAKQADENGSDSAGNSSEHDETLCPESFGSDKPAESDDAADEVGDAADENCAADSSLAVADDASGEVILPGFDEARQELESRINRLRRRLKLMGGVNTDSLRDLDELESRYNHLRNQLQDLVEAKSTLLEIVHRINAESTKLFTQTFESIRVHFRDLFRKLFGGGDGDIILEDADDLLECGIDIVARPPGKDLRSISLLSGGEKTMTAVALLLAIFKSRPSPFCILDEVDAALDEANLGRFVAVLKEFQETTQFIMITHRKPSMTVADMLYGVTMEESGVSKRMTVRFEDVGEDGSFQPDLMNSTADDSTKIGESKSAA